jgi:hypothetical protein
MAAIMAIFLSSGIQAQVYKCAGPDGSIVFSDKPCGDTAEEVLNLDSGSSGVGQSSSGPPSSLTLRNGSILQFKKIVKIEVKTDTGYRTGKTGMHIF